MFFRPRFILPNFISRPIGEAVVIVVDEDEEEIVESIVASEALLAGDFINVWDDTGTAKVRKADGSADREAHGFVLANVADDAIAEVTFHGINTALTGLTAGVIYYLSDTAGEVIDEPGLILDTQLNQVLGVAISTTELIFTYHRATEITTEEP